MSSLFLDVFVLFWGGEPAGKLRANDFLLRNVVIKNGLLTLAHALLTFCSRLLTLCSRFAHGLLTLCSRSPRFLLSPLASFWVLTRFLLGPYEGLLMVCSRFAHGLLTVCSQLAHGLLTVCARFAHGCSRFARAAHDLLMLCARFGGLCVYLDEETHKQTMPLFCCSEPCVPKAHSFQAADSLRLIFKSEKKHMPLTTLRWSGVATPLPQPEICMICMCNVPFEPKGLRKYILYYGIMTCHER